MVVDTVLGAVSQVEYRPVSQKRSTQGYWSKTSCVHYKNVTAIRNTTNKPARIVVADVLPKSNITTLKVRALPHTCLHPVLALMLVWAHR